MPLVYHHIQFPYSNLEKFKIRAHRFILFGLLPTALTLYLGVILAFSPIVGIYALIIAGLPFSLVAILYRLRK
jgi:hypothetical protein